MVVPNEQPKRQPSPSRQPSPGSRVRGRFPSRPPFRRRRSMLSTRTRPESMFIPTCIWSVSPPTATPPGPPVRCQHRRSSGDRRVVEEVPGGERSLWNPPASTGFLCSSFFKSESFEVNLVEPGQLSRCGTRPRRTYSTRSGSNGCAPRSLACSFRPLRIPCSHCVPTGGSGRCRCATPPVMSSTCRKPWSK